MGPFHSCYCTYHAVSLNLLLYLTLPAKTGCINKNVIPTLPFYSGINCISGGSGNIRNDHTVFSQKMIDQR